MGNPRIEVEELQAKYELMFEGLNSVIYPEPAGKT